MTTVVKELKGKVRIEALASRKFKNLMEYISRSDVSFSEAADFVKESGKTGLWNMSLSILTIKAKESIIGKTPKEKLEIANNLKSILFWSITLDEKDVSDYIISLDAESAIMLGEKMKQNKIWELVQKNPNVALCLI